MADEHKATVTMPDGKVVAGIDVPITESTERWSEITLQDGTIFRIRQTIGQVVRIPDEYDPEGNPMYVVKAMPTITIVSVPERLRKKG